jgi:hypothetical protein
VHRINDARWEVHRSNVYRYRVEIHKKYAIAFACLIFILLGAPFAIRFPQGGVGMVIATSVGIFFLYWMALIGGERLAERGLMEPWLAMWLPNMILAVPALWLAVGMGEKMSRTGEELGQPASPGHRDLPARGGGLMIRILDWLVARTFLRLFILFVLGAPLLFILGDATEKLDSYMDRGLPLGQVLISYAYQYPQFVFWSFPIAALLAAVFTIQPMTVHRESWRRRRGASPSTGSWHPSSCWVSSSPGWASSCPNWSPHEPRSAELRGDRERTAGLAFELRLHHRCGRVALGRRLTVNDGRMVGGGASGPRRPGREPDPHCAPGGRWTEEDGWKLATATERELDGPEARSEPNASRSCPTTGSPSAPTTWWRRSATKTR